MSAEHGTPGSSVIGGPRGMRRRAVRATELVQTGFLSNNEGRLPLLITPAVDNVDVTGWCARNAADVERYLDRHGAILFRGFPLADAPEFEAVASTIAGELFGEYGDLPPEETGARATVERACAAAGMSCEWTELGLRVRQRARGVCGHPRTGERVFFNQVQLHHVACLDQETRAAMRQLFADEDLPRNVYYGDGTPIPDDVMHRIGEVYEQLCVETPWQQGDLIALDNMLVAYDIRPFPRDRK